MKSTAGKYVGKWEMFGEPTNFFSMFALRIFCCIYSGDFCSSINLKKEPSSGMQTGVDFIFYLIILEIFKKYF